MTPAYDLAQRFLFPLCIWREAQDQPRAAKRAVAHALLNRVAHPMGPYHACHDLLSTILCHAQFSSFLPDDPNSHKLPNPVDKLGWAAWEECCDVAANPGEDATGGANFYHSYTDAEIQLWPRWADLKKETARIGAFRFYRL